MMALNLVKNLETVYNLAMRVAMRKLSKRRKMLKQGRELQQRRQSSLLQRKEEKATKRNYRLYKQLIVIK